MSKETPSLEGEVALGSIGKGNLPIHEVLAYTDMIEGAPGKLAEIYSLTNYVPKDMKSRSSSSSASSRSSRQYTQN